MEGYFQRDDNNKIMLTEEYIEKQFILEREKEWLGGIEKPLPVYYLSCSKAISNPVDLFFNQTENALYVAEMGYRHIWRIPLETGMVEDVLPTAIHINLRNDFSKYVEQVFPTLRNWDSDLRFPFNNNFLPEFLFLKHRSSTGNTTSFFYLSEASANSGKKATEPLFIKQLKLTPNTNCDKTLFKDDALHSVTSSTLYRSDEKGFTNGFLMGENKPKFNNPTSIVKLTNDLLVTDTCKLKEYLLADKPIS